MVIPSYLVLSFPFIRALQHADVIILLGARLNWILHFGLPPRYQRDVKVIQVSRKIISLNGSLLCSSIAQSNYYKLFW